jgi:hypothetical protein
MNEMTETMLTEVNMPQDATAPKAKRKITNPKVLPPRKKEVDAWIVVFPHIILIAQLEEVEATEGEPNCRMLEPFVITNTTNYTLNPYLLEYTNDNSFMIHADKILTLAKPNAVLQSKYESLLNG